VILILILILFADINCNFILPSPLA